MSASTIAERAVLASVLMDPRSLSDIADRLAVDDFGVDDYRHTYAAMLALHSRGQRPDLITVSDELRNAGKTRLADDAAFIITEAPDVIPLHIGDYASRVIRHSRQRAVTDAAMSIVRTMNEKPDADPVEVAHQALSDISRLSASDDGPKLYADVMESLQSRLTDQLAGVWDERVLPTRLSDLDRQLAGGFRPGELIILGGRPGSGKTALLLQIAHNVSRRGAPALVFSGEMSMGSLVDRGLSETTGLPLNIVRSRQLTQPQFTTLMQAAERMASMPLGIDDTSGLTTAQMLVRAQRFQRQHGLGLVVFDYLELAGDIHKQGETQRLSAISRGLKHIARTLDVPVLALSQLSRNVEQRTPPIPRMSDLRQSGGIEADADIVMLLYRHDYYVSQGMVEFDPEKAGTADIYIGKQRNGPDGKVTVAFDEASMRFLNLDRYHEDRGVA